MRLHEATLPYVPKTVDPALLTAEEYYRLVNPSSKSHPSGAYRFSVHDKNRWWKPKREEFPKPLRRIRINGIDFEFRLRVEDRHQGKFVKTNPETGEPIRGPDGETLYLSSEEVKERVKRRWEYSIGIFTDEDGYVGGSSDEWGAMLISIADEYRGFGLGPILGKMARTLEPEKSSGGFTPEGSANFRKVHREFVRDYVASGLYSHLVKSGQVTADRVREIIASARLSSRPTRKIDRNLSHSDPKEWLLMVGGYGDFILYDRKLKDLMDAEDQLSPWQERMVKAMVYVSADDRWGRIKVFGGDTPETKRFMLLLAASYAKIEKITLLVEDEDLPFLPHQVKPVSDKHTRGGYHATSVRLETPPVDWRDMQREELKFRQSFDQYDAFKDFVQTLAYTKFRVE